MSRSLAIWGAACLSGGAALAYEICWSRALVVPLGNSTDAAAMVLAGFMLGMAVGARVGGALAERTGRPLRAYAALEAGLGAYALIASPMLAALTGIHGGGLAQLVRYAAALVLIALPGLAMGASLPLLVRALARPGDAVRLHVGIAYAANTFGAALGACATGFWGIASIGVWRSTAFAAGASVCAALIAALVGDHRRGSADPLPDPPSLRGGGRSTALLATFVSGFAMLGCEMLWARVLTFVFGHDTYALSSLLMIVLLGLALGGFLQRALARFRSFLVLAALLGGFALTALGSFWMSASLVIERGRDPFGLQGVGTIASSVWLELFRELAFTPLLVLLPAVFAGAAFPAACSLYAGPRGDVGRSVGVVALVNGIGSAAGALLAAFVLVEPLGIQRAFVLMALLSGGAASLVLASRRDAPLFRSALPVAAVLIAALVIPSGLPRRMLLASVGARHQTLLHYEEARSATVSVIHNQINGERQLLINGVNEVTTRLVHDQSFKLLGHLGPLLHPAPKRALMICLGAGIAAGAAVAHPLERLEVIDLSAAVAHGARHFQRENRGVLDDPALSIHAADGRQFLLNAAPVFDVVIVDSTHPKSVDSWILYTREFYQLMRERLTPGGIAVQWLPLHGLSEREFKIVVRTFADVFPDMTLWANAGVETYGQVAYAKLVGVKDAPLRIDVARLQQRLADPIIGGDLAAYGIASLVELLDLFVASGPALSAWTSGLPIQTDDRPIVPYTTDYSQGRAMVPAILLGVRESMRPWLVVTDPAQLAELDAAFDAQGLVLAGDLSRASARRSGAKVKLYAEQAATSEPYYTALAERYADDVDKLFESATQLQGLGSPDAALPIFERALAIAPDDLRLRLNHALSLLERGRVSRAIALLAELKSEHPRSALVLLNLGAAVLASGEPSVAAVHFEEALARDPKSIAAQLALGQALFAADDATRSAAVIDALLAREPFIASAHELRAQIALRREDHALALSHAAHARRQMPYAASYAYLHGRALHASGDIDGAIAAYRDAVALDPAHADAWHALGLALAERGAFEQAADCHIRALDLDPDNAAAAHALGLSLQRQGREPAAIDAYCLALRIDPAFADAESALARLGRPRACGEWENQSGK